MKSYILPEKNVGTLAQSVAVQQGKMNLRKDEKSSFYIAEISENIILPENIQALEFKVPIQEKKPLADIASKLKAALPELPHEMDGESPNGLDVLVRLQFDQELPEEKLPVIYEELSKAIENAMKNLKRDSLED